MEKPKATTQITSAHPGDDDSKQVHETSVPYWQPGYLRRFPYLGVGSLLLVIACAVVSTVVLIASDGKSATKWTTGLRPNVVLSALNAISNLALLMAVGRGSAIAWWRKAMHGATVTQLHDSWSQSASSIGVLKSLFRLDVIGIAALAAKVSVIDGILFQRSTSTYIDLDKPPISIPMLAVAATEFPQTGYVVSDGFGAQPNCECFMIGDSYGAVVNNWETSNGFFKGYNRMFQACDGTCSASIEAIGFEIDCTKEEVNTNLAAGAIASYRASAGSSANSSAWTNLPIFNTSFSVSFSNATRNYSTIDMSVLYFQSADPYNPSSETCPGTVYNVNCAMRPALVTYPITITNYTNEHIVNGVTLGTSLIEDDDLPDTDEVINQATSFPAYSYNNKQAEGFSVGAYLYPEEHLTVNSTTHLGGIANALSQYLSSTASITYTGAALWALKQQGTLAQTMMYGPPNMGSCDCSFKATALDSIVGMVNQLAFLTATGLIDSSTFTFPPQALTSRFSMSPNASPKLSVNTSTTVTIQGIGQNLTTNFRALEGVLEIRDVVHFRTDFVYMYVALVFTVLCVLLVCPMYWKYGELGRDCTLGPIEIAGAFRAPILTHATQPSTTTADMPASPHPAPPASPTVPTIAFANVKELLEEVGDRKVTYGFVDVEEPAHSSHPGSLHLGSPITTTFKRRSVLAFESTSYPNVKPAAGVLSPPTSPRV